MSKNLIGKCLFGAFISLGVVLANNVKTPTCKAAVEAMDQEASQSEDCFYSYTNAKTLSVDKANGVVTCQAIASRECPYMPEENTKETIKFTAKYGIVTQQIYEDEGY